MSDRIDVTGVDLVELAKAAYDLSEPRGLGFLHAREGGLSHEDAVVLVDEFPDLPHLRLYMDYVHGRGCKLTASREDDRLFISARWYDHTDEQLRQLLARVGMADRWPGEREHQPACDCIECRFDRAAVTSESGG